MQLYMHRDFAYLFRQVRSLVHNIAIHHRPYIAASRCAPAAALGFVAAADGTKTKGTHS